MKTSAIVAACGLAALLACAPRALSDDLVARGRELIRSKDLRERVDGVKCLIQANSKESVQPLEDFIRATLAEMDKVAKDLDKLDIRFDEAVGYWNAARESNDSGFMDLAKRHLDMVKKQWRAEATRLIFHLEVIRYAGEGFASFTDKAAVGVIEAGARSEPDPLLRQWYVRGLARPDRAESIPSLIGLLRSKDPLTRAVAARALHPFAMDRRVFDAWVAALGDKAWQVRLAAYQGLARAPLDHAAPPLVAAAARESGEIARAVDALLASLLGVSFPQNPRQWEAWWKENGDAAVAGTHERGAPEGDSSGGTAETFFSIPIESWNVLFLLDYSSSMEDGFDEADARNREIRAAHRLGATRLGVAQAEAIRAIRGLPPEARVQLVVYSDKAKRYAERPVAATDGNKSAAIAWLLQQKTGWLTNVWDGLRLAFNDVLGPGANPTKFLDMPDTIVFLTDGEPTRGRFQGLNSLYILVRLWNSSVGAVVHTVGIGEEHDAALLKALAEATDGFYLDVTKPTRDFRRTRLGVPEKEREPSVAATVATLSETLASEDAEGRPQAALALCRYATWSPAALDRVMAALADDDARVREETVKGLAALAPQHTPGVVARLLPLIETAVSGSYSGADAAMQLIRAYGARAVTPGADGQAVVAALARVVASGDSEHRAQAAQTLGALGPSAKAAVPALQAAQTDAPEELRPVLAAALKAILKK